MSTDFVCVEFEVFGRVQGVFFRKYTQAQGQKLGLKGWCMNTSGGTVKGAMEGEVGKVEAMKKWLQEVGSPQSSIERAVFSNPKPLEKCTLKDFSIKR